MRDDEGLLILTLILVRREMEELNWMKLNTRLKRSLKMGRVRSNRRMIRLKGKSKLVSQRLRYVVFLLPPPSSSH